MLNLELVALLVREYDATRMAPNRTNSGSGAPIFRADL